jgi:hypothetical protein
MNTFSRPSRQLLTCLSPWVPSGPLNPEKQSLKAVVALMRKLARALGHAGRGATFDPTKLFARAVKA